MPEDLPKAVLVLIWLLSGTIIFGALLMTSSILVALLFALLFFGVPVIYTKLKNKPEVSS